MVTADVLGPAKAREFAAMVCHEAHRTAAFNAGVRPEDPPWEALSHAAKDFWCRQVDDALISTERTLTGIVAPAAFKVALGYFG